MDAIMTKKTHKSVRPLTVVIYIILIAVGIFMVLPTLIMVLSSFKTYDEYYSLPFKFISEVWAADNYARVFGENSRMLLWTSNTLILIVSNTVLCTFSTTLVAYGFAKFKCKAADVFFVILLSTMMIPWAVTMIPSYMLWSSLNMTDTFMPLILPSIGGSAYYIFLFKQSMRGIPKEITEAAEIDGINTFGCLWRIIVPNIIPAIVTMVLFTCMGIWGDYLGPLIYLRTPEKFNISLGLNMMRSVAVQGKQDTPMLLAASVLMAIPSIIMYFVGTKVFTKGISLQGGVKG